MKRRLERLRRKLRSRRGDSIAEVLIAILIVAIGLTLLAGMISYSARMVLKSEDDMQDYIGKENGIVSRSESAADPGGSHSVSLSLDQGLTEGDESSEIGVNIYTIEMPDGDVVAYAIASGGEGS